MLIIFSRANGVFNINSFLCPILEEVSALFMSACHISHTLLSFR